VYEKITHQVQTQLTHSLTQWHHWHVRGTLNANNEWVKNAEKIWIFSFHSYSQTTYFDW